MPCLALYDRIVYHNPIAQMPAHLGCFAARVLHFAAGRDDVVSLLRCFRWIGRCPCSLCFLPDESVTRGVIGATGVTGVTGVWVQGDQTTF